MTYTQESTLRAILIDFQKIEAILMPKFKLMYSTESARKRANVRICRQKNKEPQITFVLSISP